MDATRDMGGLPMSASQQAQNKKLHQLVDQLEDQIDALKTERDQLKIENGWFRDENKRLRDLIPQAWQAGQARLMGSHKDFQQTHPTLREWMKQKGLA